MKGPVADGEIDARWNDIEMIAFDAHPVDGLKDRHRRMFGQQIDHHAVMGRIEMLNQDECDSAPIWAPPIRPPPIWAATIGGGPIACQSLFGGKRGDEPGAGVKPAGGRADPDHGQPMGVAGWIDGRRSARMPAFRCNRRLGALRHRLTNYQGCLATGGVAELHALRVDKLINIG